MDNGGRADRLGRGRGRWEARMYEKEDVVERGVMEESIMRAAIGSHYILELLPSLEET